MSATEKDNTVMAGVHVTKDGYGVQEMNNFKKYTEKEVYFAVKGPFYDRIRAAHYCGYAPDTFDRHLQEYNLPKYGPKQNRYSESVLDKSAVNSETFEG